MLILYVKQMIKIGQAEKFEFEKIELKMNYEKSLTSKLE